MKDKKPNLEGKIELDEVLLKARNSTKAFIEQLEQEEAGERIETVDAVRNRMKAESNNTNRKKMEYINDMKNGVGQEIKEKKARGVKIKKFTLKDKIGNFFKALYTKF